MIYKKMLFDGSTEADAHTWLPFMTAWEKSTK